MSYTELQSGKMKILGIFSEVEVEEYMKHVVEKEFPDVYKNITENGFPCWSDNWMEVYNDHAQNKEMYIYTKSILFKVFNVKNYEDYGYFCDVQKTDDNEYRFITQYYNGGTCLSEILEEEADKIADKL